MARKYVRKTQRGADDTRYTQDDLKAAIADVKNGKKQRGGHARHIIFHEHYTTT